MTKMTLEEIAMLVAFIVGLLKGFDYLYGKFIKPKSDMEKALDELKKTNEELTKAIKNTNAIVENHEDRLTTVENEQCQSKKDRSLLKEFIAILFPAVQALVNVPLGIATEEELRKSAKDMEEFLKNVALKK